MKKPTALVYTMFRGYLLSNYGTFFQHFALRETLKSFAWTPYRFCGVEHPYWCLTLRRFFFRWLLLLNKIKLISLPISLYNEYLRILTNEPLFIASYKKLIGPLVENQSHPQAIIAGSDQIWTHWDGTKRLLKQFPNHNRIISYAASADWAQIRYIHKWASDATHLFTSFSDISFREMAGVKICQPLCPDKICQHCIDPAFLLKHEDYLKVSSAKVFFLKPTLFVYMVNIENANAFPLKGLETVAQTLKCDLRILGIQGCQNYIPAEYQIIPSPEEFLSLYRDAQYVITNSFHGTVFALIFKKSFLSIKQRTHTYDNKGQNIRLSELFKRLHLDKHYLYAEDIIHQGVSCLTSPIDWTSITLEINNWRETSLTWLINALTR